MLCGHRAKISYRMKHLRRSIAATLTPQPARGKPMKDACRHPADGESVTVLSLKAQI